MLRCLHTPDWLKSYHDDSIRVTVDTMLLLHLVLAISPAGKTSRLLEQNVKHAAVVPWTEAVSCLLTLCLLTLCLLAMKLISLVDKLITNRQEMRGPSPSVAVSP